MGTKGARVNAVVEELGGEKIDIIPWSPDPLEFIAKALSPAKVIKVMELDGENTARAVVPDDKRRSPSAGTGRTPASRCG